jgi:hypothetical protein
MAAVQIQVTADHNQFLVYNGASEAAPEYDGDGLIAAYPGGVVVFTGQTYGVLDVTLEPFDERPPHAADTWTKVSETSLEVTTGPLAVGDLMNGPALGALNLATRGHGPYRVRVCARNRAEGRASSELTPSPEEFLIQCWPAPLAADSTLRQEDRLPRPLHDEPARSVLPGTARKAFEDLCATLPSLPNAPAHSTVQVTHSLPAGVTATRANELLRRQSVFSFWLGQAGTPVVAGRWSAILVPRISLTIVGTIESSTPDSVTLEWNWSALTEPSPTDPFPRQIFFLNAPSRLELTVQPRAESASIAVLHTGLPSQLASVMKTLWLYYLERFGLYCLDETFPTQAWD